MTFRRGSYIVEGTSKNSSQHGGECLSKWNIRRKYSCLQYANKSRSITQPVNEQDNSFWEAKKRNETFTKDAIPRTSAIRSLPLRNISANAPCRDILLINHSAYKLIQAKQSNRKPRPQFSGRLKLLCLRNTNSSDF